MVYHSVRCGGICNVIRLFWLYSKGCIILVFLERLITCDAMAMFSEGTLTIYDYIRAITLQLTYRFFVYVFMHGKNVIRFKDLTVP